METILKLQLYGFCLVVILILWLSCDRRESARADIDTRLYRALLLSIALMVISDSIIILLNSTPGIVARDAMLVFSASYYVFHTLPIGFFILYTHFQIFKNTERFRSLVLPLAIIEALVAIASIASIFTGILFAVDKANHYRRGSWFPAFAIIQYGLVLFSLIQIVANVKRLKRRVFVTLLTNPLPSLLAGLLQLIFYGLVLVWPTATLFLLISFVNIENRRSKTDYLTGTANRRSLDEELERRIELTRQGRPLCGLLLDIDDFKKINDNFGHEAGDRALEDIADILLSTVRVEDHVARLGGDEFVILVDFKDPMAMEDLVRRIEREIENLNGSKLRMYRLSSSIGRSAYRPEEGGGASDFLSLLDADMYARKREKAKGREGA